MQPTFGLPGILRQLWYRDRLKLAFRATASLLLAAMYLGPTAVDWATPDIERRFRRALVALRVLKASGVQQFQPTLGGQVLFGLPGVVRKAILQFSRSRTDWFELVLTLKTGLPVPRLMLGKTCWEYLAENNQAAESFHSAVKFLSAPLRKALLEVHDWSTTQTVVDVGGGRAYLLRNVHRSHPHLHIVLFDLPDVVMAAAKELARATPESGKIELQAGSFLDAVPHGGDVYLLANVLHNWDDNRALRILQNCRAAFSDSSHLLIIEPVISETHPGWLESALDLQMHLLFQGKERTVPEHETLLQSAGFKLGAHLPVVWPHTLLWARPV
jgi:O-methyltransferase domain